MAQMLEYKCPCCGGAVKFDSASQKVKCPYCDTEFDVEAFKKLEQEAAAREPEQETKWETSGQSEWQQGEADGMQVFTCQSCGGEIVADENTAATSCPYCGNPVVLTGRLSGMLRPEYVIPFKLDKKQAKEGLKKHLMGKKLLPKVFRSENHLDEIKGVYVPFWIFEAKTNADLEFRGTRVRYWSDKHYDYTETKVYSIQRGGSLSFEHIPADGSSHMADDLMESLEPYDFKEAVSFETAYLAGYLADKYDVTAEECKERINRRVKNSTEQELRNTISGYDSVTLEQERYQLSRAKASYALYPVWLLQTSWKGQNYLFAMNGQTGKFVGNLPMDKGLFWKYFGSITAISGAIIYLILWIINLLQIYENTKLKEKRHEKEKICSDFAAGLPARQCISLSGGSP